MIVAGTGHRPDKLGGYNEAAHMKLVDLATGWLEKNEPKVVISGMALGWDTALAESALQSGITLWAYIPFEGQELRWPDDSRKRFGYIRDRAAKIVICSEGGYAPYKMQVRNERMVNHCDTVLALWNRSNGGTCNCLKYANQKLKPTINLWNQYIAMRD